MSDKHNEVIEIPGIREEDHAELIAGARMAQANGLDSFIEGVFASAEEHRKNRVDITP